MSEYSPLVSVCCITYNHENYIRDAIEGFLLQKTSFPIEVIIHDDASIDRTAEIVTEYAEKYPKIIKPILQTENQYSQGVKVSPTFVWPRAKGKYIALCEGDDYWTDPYKLQEQVDFLEENYEYGMSHTDCNFLYENEGRMDYSANKRMTRNGKIKINQEIFENILLNNYRIRTASVLVRTNLLQKIRNYKDYNKIISRFPMGDTPIWLEMSRISKIHYINKAMVVYRVLENSACRIQDPFQDQLFQLRALELRLYYMNKYQVTNKTKRIIKYKFLRKISRLYLNGFNFEMIIPSHMYKNILFILIVFFGKIYRYLLTRNN